MRQTTVQEFNSIRFGSGKFEVDSGDGQGWVDLGAMRNIVFEEEWEKVRVMSDNAGPVTVGIRNHSAALAGDLMEINLENLYRMRGGLDDFEAEVAAEATEVEDEPVLIIDGDTPSRLKYRNADGTAVTVTAVKDADGESYAGADYDTFVDAQGYTNIKKEGAEIDDGETVYVTYEYTPAAHRKFETGGRKHLSPVAVRVTNKNEDEEEFIIEVYKAETEEGINIEFQADEDEDPAMIPIRLTGDVDTTKDVGKQLFRILDYQTK